MNPVMKDAHLPATALGSASSSLVLLGFLSSNHFFVCQRPCELSHLSCHASSMASLLSAFLTALDEIVESGAPQASLFMLLRDGFEMSIRRLVSSLQIELSNLTEALAHAQDMLMH